MTSSSSLKVTADHSYITTQESSISATAFLNLLKIVGGDISLASDFTKLWLIREFKLGEELLRYGLGGETQDSSNVLYLVCFGRVRVLSYERSFGREVSTQLLFGQHCFGSDHLFCHEPLPYRVIAASAGKVAQVTVSELMLWLQRLPNLQNYLQRMADERQALIFLKTVSELRSVRSHTLRHLLPYLVKTKVSAGLSLVEATPPAQGRFWLFSGKIHSSVAETQPPRVGESWGYPDLTLPNWSAQSDLLLYHLSIENWQSARSIIPEFFTNNCEVVSYTTQVVSDNNSQILPKNSHNLIELPVSENLTAAETTPDRDFDVPQQVLRWRKLWLWWRTPFVPQQNSSDCGAACLAMISLYWGKRFSLSRLRNLARNDRTGASLSALADAAQTLGYQAIPVRASLSKVESQPYPWIAHWQGIHYVVVWRFQNNRVLISDPSMGKRWLSVEEFEANWTEYALLLSPTERLKAAKSENISLAGLGKVVWEYRKLLGLIILTTVVLHVFELVTPLITQVVLDSVIPQNSLVALNVFAVGFFVFGVASTALSAVRQLMLDSFANRMEFSLIGGFINHTLRLPLQFFISRQVGDMITQVQEHRKVQLFLTRRAVTTTLNAVMAVFYLGLMTYYSLGLTLLVFSWILLIVTLTIGTSPFLKTLSREIYRESVEHNSSMVEMLTGVATVKTAAAEQRVGWRWEARFTKFIKARFHGQKLANTLQAVTSLINHLGNTAVLWYGATLVMREEVSIGQFVAFNLLKGNAINPILALAQLWDQFQDVLISRERLNDVLATEVEENPQKPLLVLPPIRKEVYFENVCFRFHQDQDRNTLQNITFKVKAGQCVALVGRSGSGKSTLANLLAGLYRPTSGRILIDGYDIAHVSPHSLRTQLGFVPQDCFLFSGSILENITLFNSEYSLEQVIAATKLAEAHTFIQALPLGYNTQVGDRGMMLSGGQRQKIAIARALIHNPRILILDEATSFLDAESEHQFQQNIADRASHEAGITFTITHRLSTIRYADLILVLDRGILVEQGNHDELMTIEGFYYHLAQQQLHL
jgi:HlyB family type I secretion system ABC transporter